MNPDTTDNEVARLRKALRPFIRYAQLHGSTDLVGRNKSSLSRNDWEAAIEAYYAPAPEEAVSEYNECKKCGGVGVIYGYLQGSYGPSACHDCTGFWSGKTVKVSVKEPTPEWRIRAEGERIEPLEKELDYLTKEASRAADIHNHVVIVDCLRLLRDEIEQLKKNQK
jgi:hypothetical protein